MVKAKVTVLGTPFEAIIKTGASDTVMSHPVVGRMDELEHGDVTFPISKWQDRDLHGWLKRVPYWRGQPETAY